MSPETLVLIQNQYGGLPLAAMGGGGEFFSMLIIVLKSED